MNIGAVAQTAPKVAHDVGAVVTDPGALYTAALAEVQGDPNTRKDLGAVSNFVLSRGAQIIASAVGAEAKLVGEAVLNATIDLIGPGTIDAMAGIASEVAGAVSQAMPVISMVFGEIESQMASIDAQQKAWKLHQTDLAAAVLDRPVIASEPNGKGGGMIVPSDIFAWDPENLPSYVPPEVAWTNGHLYGTTIPENPVNVPYPFMPRSTLGIIFAAITEDSADDYAPHALNQFGVNPPDVDNGNPPGVVTDSNLHHSPWFWENTNAQTNNFGKAAVANLIPPARRRIYQLLRRAMGAINDDKGRLLWPIYMDMLAADLDAGNLAWSQGMLTSVFCDVTHDGTFAKSFDQQDLVTTDPTAIQGNELQNLVRSAEPWTPAQVAPFVAQIVTMINTWKQQRNHHMSTAFQSVAVQQANMRAITYTPARATGLLGLWEEFLAWLRASGSGHTHPRFGAVRGVGSLYDGHGVLNDCVRGIGGRIVIHEHAGVGRTFNPQPDPPAYHGVGSAPWSPGFSAMGARHPVFQRQDKAWSTTVAGPSDPGPLCHILGTCGVQGAGAFDPNASNMSDWNQGSGGYLRTLDGRQEFLTNAELHLASNAADTAVDHAAIQEVAGCIGYPGSEYNLNGAQFNAAVAAVDHARQLPGGIRAMPSTIAHRPVIGGSGPVSRVLIGAPGNMPASSTGAYVRTLTGPRVPISDAEVQAFLAAAMAAVASGQIAANHVTGPAVGYLGHTSPPQETPADAAEWAILVQAVPRLGSMSTASGGIAGLWAKFIAWLKGLFGPSSTPAVAGVGLLGSPSAIVDDCADGGWCLQDVSTGESRALSDAEAAAAQAAADTFQAPPPVFHPGVPNTAQHDHAQQCFLLHNGQGIGIAMSRAQGRAAMNAIATLSQARAPSQSGAILSKVPYQGGYVQIDADTWEAAIEGRDAGAVPGDADFPPVDAAVSVIEAYDDPETAQAVADGAKRGDPHSALVMRAMVDGHLVACRMVARELAEGVNNGEPDALELAQAACQAAANGDSTALVLCRAIGDALDAYGG